MKLIADWRIIVILIEEQLIFSLKNVYLGYVGYVYVPGGGGLCIFV